MYLGLNKNQTFSCKQGKMQVLKNYGIIPSDSQQKDYCGDRNTNPDIEKCNSYLYPLLFEADFSARC